RQAEHHRQVGWARTFGLPLEELSAGEARRLFPLMSEDEVRGALFLPTDGHLDPASLAMALAEGARRRGVRILTGTRVLALDVRRGRVHGVETSAETIQTE